MNYDPFDLVGQERSAEETKQREKLERRIEAEDIKWQMKTKQGRRIMWRLLGQAGVFRSSFAEIDSRTNFNEGQRNLGVMWLTLINEHCAPQYALMVAEAKERSNQGPNNG